MSLETVPAARVAAPKPTPLGRLSRLISARTSIVLVFVIVQIGGVLFVPHYATLDNFKAIMTAVPTLGIVTLGVTLLMTAGEFDLSVGSVYAFASAVMTWLLNQAGVPLWLAFLLGLVTGIATGVINGAITVRAGIPSFITTLGTMMVFRGLAMWIMHGRPVAWKPAPWFTRFLGSSMARDFLPVAFLWFIGLAIVLYFVLERSRFGNWVYATGGNKAVARALGININRVKIICFASVGCLAALAGVVESLRMRSVFVTQGQGLELNAIAAAVIGGASLYGGQSYVLGSVLGAIILYTIQDILLLLRLGPFHLQAFVGGLIILTSLLNVYIQSRSK